MAKIKEKMQKDDKKVLLIAQDIKFAKSLSCNNKKVRDRALKALKKWLQLRLLRMPFTEKDFMIIWKGLFYSMWMSDKMLIQEECAENISALVHFPTWEDSLLFFKCGLRTLIDQWFGIDQLRLDKFAMFVRRLLRQSLVVLSDENWNQQVVDKYNEILCETVLNTEKLPPVGLGMHFVEIYLEELSKVSKGEIGANIVTTLLKPFMRQIALIREPRLTSHIHKFIFRYLMWQSDLGIDYNERYREWKQRGFPGGTIDVIQKQELSDDEIMSDNENEADEDAHKPLDPRAGYVDVELPQIPIDPKEIGETLKNFRFIKNTTTRNRRAINKIINEFEQMVRGEFPLGSKEVPVLKKDPSISIKNSLKRLANFEKELLAKEKKKRKKPNEEEQQSENQLKKKKRNIVPNDDSLKHQLEKFIQESEGDLLDDMRNSAKIKKKIIPKKSDINEMNKVLTKRKKLATNLYKTDKLKVKSTKLKRMKTLDMDPQGSFQRNSGIWYVYDVQNPEDDKKTPNSDIHVSKDAVEDKILSPNTPKEITHIIEKSKSDKLILKSPRTSYKILNSENTITASPLTSLKKTEESPSFSVIKNKKADEGNVETNILKVTKPLINTTTISKRRLSLQDSIVTSTPEKLGDVLFPKSEWDTPPKEGEIEILIPSKKYKQKLIQKHNQTLPTILKGSIKKTKKKDPNMVRNPFSKLNLTENSAKKVKIALNLNKSQEIHEHFKMIKSSPAIPFDAERKPSKPLLKKPVIASPINPFYRHKLSL